MAALDFPNAPTVGQQYVAPNGATYQWDGAAWIIAGSVPAVPSGPAGGDLTGTYPNPSVSPAAKSKWTDTGATLTPTGATKQVVIPGPTGAVDSSQLVLGTSAITGKGRVTKIAGLDWMGMTHNAWYDGSAWQRDDTAKSGWMISAGGTTLYNSFINAAGVQTNPLVIDGPSGKTTCTLADKSVTRPMLAIGSAYQTFAQVSVTASVTVNSGAWTRISPDAAAITTRGGVILVALSLGAKYVGNATANTVYVGFGVNGAVTLAMRYDVSSAANAGLISIPIPGWSFWWAQGAGTYVFSAWALVGNGNGSFFTAGDSTGFVTAIELS